MNRLAILIILMSMLSCSSQDPIVKVSPVKDNIDWYMGKQIVLEENDKLTVGVCFQRSTPSYFIFDVEVLNNSNEKILIEPNQFRLVPISFIEGQYLSEADYDYGPAVALDPEQRIYNLQKMTYRNNTAIKAANTLSLIALATSVAQDINKAKKGNETAAEYQHRKRKLDETIYVNQTIKTTAEIKKEKAQKSLKFWSEDVLRKTTLYPEESIRGLVFFPRKDWLNTFGLMFPIVNDAVMINFEVI